MTKKQDGENLFSDIPNREFPDEIPLEEYTVTQTMKVLGTCRSNVMGMIARGSMRARKPICQATGNEIDEWRILRMDVDAQMARRVAGAIQILESILGPGRWVTSLREKSEAGPEVAQVGARP